MRVFTNQGQKTSSFQLMRNTSKVGFMEIFIRILVRIVGFMEIKNRRSIRKVCYRIIFRRLMDLAIQDISQNNFRNLNISLIFILLIIKMWIDIRKYNIVRMLVRSLIEF